MRIFQDANYDFIGKRRTAYIVSVALLLVGIAFALYWQVSQGSWLNYGVDFRGGTLVQVRFDQPTSVSELRQLVSTRLGRPEVTRFGGENEFLIRAPEFAEEGETVSDVIVATLSERFGEDQYTVVRTESVGAKVGAELQTRAAYALLMSLLITLGYLAFRFEWRFGVAALIATAHDMLATLGLIAALQLDFALPTVAAVLTIIGYSLNDTIIVFDRIRENLKRLGRREAYVAILNQSINQTLPRTTLTTGTTLVALMSLYMLGGPIIRDFALILIFGIVLGTYSSIFVAAPLLYEIERRWPKERKRGTGEPHRPERAAPPARSGV